MKILFYTLLLPLLFFCTSVLSFRFPGDEYALWGVSSIAGTWAAFLIGVGDIHQWWIPWSFALIGSVVVGVFALGMDKLKVPRALWLVLYLAAATAFCLVALSGYESYDRAISKNGSFTAYALASLNMGLYVSILGSLAVWGLKRMACWKCGKSRRDDSMLKRESR